eukprot:GHUV01040578.1.p1 GENE.GHUV01040578.1~~GHUV01040578.1.p1  ORF type:complete len:134 (-),score=17.47 GHUV01040578.1:59-460(-)
MVHCNGSSAVDAKVWCPAVGTYTACALASVRFDSSSVLGGVSNWLLYTANDCSTRSLLFPAPSGLRSWQLQVPGSRSAASFAHHLANMPAYHVTVGTFRGPYATSWATASHCTRGRHVSIIISDAVAPSTAKQ